MVEIIGAGEKNFKGGGSIFARLLLMYFRENYTKFKVFYPWFSENVRFFARKRPKKSKFSEFRGEYQPSAVLY